MKVINTLNEELTSQSIIDSHNEVLKYCEEIERIYNVDVLIKHTRGMEYVINIIDKDTDKILCICRKNIPSKVKNYLKGLIDAHKIQLK